MTGQQNDARDGVKRSISATRDRAKHGSNGQRQTVAAAATLSRMTARWSDATPAPEPNGLLRPRVRRITSY